MDYPEPYVFELPFATHYANFGIHPRCPICGDLPPELRGIDIQETYNEIMQELSIPSTSTNSPS